MAPNNEQWSDLNTKRFLLYVAFALGGSPASHFPAIAEKMGPTYTTGSLSNKWQRLKAEVEKEGGLPTGSGPAAKGGKKTKTKKVADGGEVEEQPKPKRGRKRKADSVSPVATPEKTIKDDVEGSEDGEIKEEAQDEEKLRVE